MMKIKACGICATEVSAYVTGEHIVGRLSCVESLNNVKKIEQSAHPNTHVKFNTWDQITVYGLKGRFCIKILCYYV